MVLIVEPSRDLARIMKRAFGRNGIKSVVAHSAQSGVQVADKHQPKLVILELLMSKHNGFEFIHEFKSYPDWFDIPIVIYSDLSAEELAMEKGVNEGMDIIQHFYKPTATLAQLIKFAKGVLG